MQDSELILHASLQTMSLEQLRALLNAETARETPDDDLVLAILHFLEERDPVDPEPVTDREKIAWKRYRKRVRARRKVLGLHTGNLMRVASVMLVACLLFAMLPQQAQADNWWQRLTRWTDEFFGFFREDQTFLPEICEFRTDNPGLQQVYDAVVELGVTVPVVPMWLPGGYELVECTTTVSPRKSYVYARFSNAVSECLLQVNLLNAEGSKFYFKDETAVKKYESSGTAHNVISNGDKWIVTWTRDNIEGAFTIDCPEDVLYEIIESIYKWRINE